MMMMVGDRRKGNHSELHARRLMWALGEAGMGTQIAPMLLEVSLNGLRLAMEGARTLVILLGCLRVVDWPGARCKAR